MNCLIIDDEPLAIDVIVAHCKRIPELNVVETCNNAMEAFQALHKHEIQLIFLDINMPVISGLSFLKSLKEPPAVILTTAYTEYAIEGYELDVVDYLLKPIPFERFAMAIQKVQQRLSRPQNISGINIPAVATPAIHPGTYNSNTSTKDFIFIKSNGKLVKLNFSDIRYIEGMKDYLKIFTSDKTHVIHQTMKAMEEQLPEHLFMRVHKSYIVALDAIQQIDGNCIETASGGVPLSNTYRDVLLKTIEK
ncbi:LytTR family DNA-binding domain-containing protein [Taibaiella sp. KBW10]|uniref:LytR/AlgR family response regulator transcription factor n=1 Tax=Taibaiella sp. KBW10 TaxID=2153357 RepID=UPI001315504A|nr:LytTR family DNA-binding domain-containing protein [Taibaiella sp. KBW10]